MKTFEMIARKRAEILGQKYLDEQGINRAMYERDNIEDIVEELADANNIAYLYFERIGYKYNDDKDNSYLLDNMNIELEQMIKNNTKTANRLLAILNDPKYPPELRKESIIRVGIDDYNTHKGVAEILKTWKTNQTPEQEILNQHEIDKGMLSNQNNEPIEKQSLCHTCKNIRCKSVMPDSLIRVCTEYNPSIIVKDYLIT